MESVQFSSTDAAHENCRPITTSDLEEWGVGQNGRSLTVYVVEDDAGINFNFASAIAANELTTVYILCSKKGVYSQVISQ